MAETPLQGGQRALLSGPLPFCPAAWKTGGAQPRAKPTLRHEASTHAEVATDESPTREVQEPPVPSQALAPVKGQEWGLWPSRAGPGHLTHPHPSFHPSVGT